MKTDLLKILLVDDEYLIRELLKKRIKWESLGCEIVGEASCAAQAFDVLEEVDVDIIITDINMPVTDGIEMSGKILESYPKIKIIVLTGYDKFEYAQNGIKIGIEDYILKPIQDAEIEKAVRHVKYKLEKERKAELESQAILQRLEKNLPYLKERFLLELFNNRLSSEEIEEKQTFFKLNFSEAFYQVALIEWTYNLETKLSQESRLLMLLGILNLIQATLGEKENTHILIDANHRIAIFSNNPDTNLIETCNYLLKVILINFKGDVMIGVGGIKTNALSITDSYREASTALLSKIISGNNQVVCYSDLGMLSNELHGFSEVDADKIEKLLFFVKSGLKENAFEVLEEIYQEMSTYSNIEDENYIEFVRVQTTRILSVLIHVMTSMNIKMEQIFIGEKDCFAEVVSLRMLPQAKQLLLEVVGKMIHNINGVQSCMVNNYMDEITAYIQENMGDYSLTLNKIAAHFYVSPSYLSRIFKQKKGIAFKDYINKMRMQKAIEYVRHTEMKAYEIGELIGMPEANYFSTLFKKYVGMPITEYKKSITDEMKLNN